MITVVTHIYWSIFFGKILVAKASLIFVTIKFIDSVIMKNDLI